MLRIVSLAIVAASALLVIPGTAGAQTGRDAVRAAAITDMPRQQHASISPQSITRAAAKAADTLGRAPVERFSVATQFQQSGAQIDQRPRAFLRSPVGLAAVAILGVGVSYGLYSKMHDRVHSKNPER
jgi:hypothetical protein